jgi:hypothetical protein
MGQALRDNASIRFRDDYVIHGKRSANERKARPHPADAPILLVDALADASILCADALANAGPSQRCGIANRQ